MTLLPGTLTFDDTPVVIIDRESERWVTARALGCADESAVLRVYSRNRDELTEEMSATIDIRSHGEIDGEFPERNNANVRIFRSRGR